MPHGVPQPGGFPPQGYGALPYTPVDKRQIRPRLLWIWLAWLVAVVAVIGGVAGFVSGVLSTVEAAAPSETFPPGETRSLTLDPADRPTLYVATPQLIAYECTISDGTLTNAAGSTTVTINGVVWRHILDVNVPRAGEYQLRCDIRGDATGVRFGVAKSLGTTVAGLGGSVLLLLIAFGGVLMAIIVTIVVVVRRSSARKRLSASYGR